MEERGKEKQRKDTKGDDIVVTITRMTISYNKDEDTANIYLYSGNTMIHKLDSCEVGIKAFSKSGAKNKTIYLNYCKEYMINLITNGGMEGFEYKESDTTKQDGQITKIATISDMNAYFINKVAEILKSLGYEQGVTVGPSLSSPDVSKRYKNGSIEYATAKNECNIDGILIQLELEIKSGQPCKPKWFIFEDKRYSLNGTNLRKVIGR